MHIEQFDTDILVVGSGMAGLCAAIAAQEAGLRVLVLSAAAPGASSATTITRMAGAFVSAALGPDDSPAQHASDTITSGRGLAGEPAVRVVTEDIIEEVPRLERLGVAFRRTDDGGYYLFRSPGHTRSRTITHGPGAATSVAGILAEAAEAAAGIEFLGGVSVTGIHVGGDGAAAVSAWHHRERAPIVVVAGAVVLATGGSGLVYRRSGIPRGVPGNGAALALMAGCSLVDMEFLQMYPTALAEEGQHHHLLQYEYLLELGAVLRNAVGDDVLAEAARTPADITRDQLCQRIGQEILHGRADDQGRLHFDVSGCRPADTHPVLRDSPYVSIIGARFGRPGGRVPVAPTAHTFLGGVLAADTDGATNVPGLYVCGEAMGAVHGANRLQGNALAECAVIGRRAGLAAASHARHAGRPPDVDEASEAAADLATRLTRRGLESATEVLDDLQSVLSTHVGLVRSSESLGHAAEQLAVLRERSQQASAADGREERLLAVLPQLITTAEAITAAATTRTESRGAHFRSDAPTEADHGSSYRTSIDGYPKLHPGRAPV